jgi:hypothetical protein
MSETNPNSAESQSPKFAIPPISLRRRFTDHAMTGIAVFTVALVLLPLFAIFAYLVYKGIGSINLAFLTQTPKPVGEAGGGMANAIAGSVVILGIASLMGVPLGIGAGIFLSEYGRNRYGDIVRFVSDVLNGVPSIVIGIVAYGLVVMRQKHFSALAPPSRCCCWCRKPSAKPPTDWAFRVGALHFRSRCAPPPLELLPVSCWLSRGWPEKLRRSFSQRLGINFGIGRRINRPRLCRCKFSPTPFLLMMNGTSRHGPARWF